jgi:hypothetical protein
VSDETPEERAAAWLALPWPNEDGIASTLARDVLALSAEVDRLRHGEKVRDGEVCGQWCSLHASTADLDDDRCAYRRHWSVSGECTFSPVYREVAVLAALDTEQDTEQ